LHCDPGCGRRARADALERVGRVRARRAGFDPIREAGADRIGQHDLHAWIRSLQRAPDSRQRAASASARDECADRPACLSQDLWPRGAFVDADVGGVGKLVRKQPTVFCRHRARHVLEVLRARERRVLRDHDARAERLQRHAFVDRHLLRHHADESVAAHGRDDREANSRVACGRFDDRVPCSERATRFCILDDGERDAILDRTAGVHVLALPQDRDRQAAADALQLDERRVADVREDAHAIAEQSKAGAFSQRPAEKQRPAQKHSGAADRGCDRQPR